MIHTGGMNDANMNDADLKAELKDRRLAVDGLKPEARCARLRLSRCKYVRPSLIDLSPALSLRVACGLPRQRTLQPQARGG